MLVPKLQKELIREVEMGPFKHTVDDGLDLRKAAFECMYTLLETCLDRLDVFEFLNHMEDGLRDHYDIKVCMNAIFFIKSTTGLFLFACMFACLTNKGSAHAFMFASLLL